MRVDRQLDELVGIAWFWRRAIGLARARNDADADSAAAAALYEGAADGSHHAAAAAGQEIHTQVRQELADGTRFVSMLQGAGAHDTHRLHRESRSHLRGLVCTRLSSTVPHPAIIRRATLRGGSPCPARS